MDLDTGLYQATFIVETESIYNNRYSGRNCCHKKSSVISDEAFYAASHWVFFSVPTKTFYISIFDIASIYSLI